LIDKFLRYFTFLVRALATKFLPREVIQLKEMTQVTMDCFTHRSIPILIITGYGSKDGGDFLSCGNATDCFPLVPRGRNDGMLLIL